MKKLTNFHFALLLFAITGSFLSSCQKAVQEPAQNSTGNNATTKSSTTSTSATNSASVTSSAFVNNQAIVVSATPGDTVYAVGTCTPGSKADTLAFSALPAAISTYLTANYAGYTFVKAYETLNATNVVQGYIVNITFNGNPVGLKFNGSGVFLNVLEQRQAQDLQGQGWHQGGQFGNRDGKQKDTIALTALPPVITTYFTTNYPKDTLKHALIDRDSSYVVVSANSGVFITEFTSAGVFIKRVQVSPHVVTSTTLTQGTLPAPVGTYLTNTYPAFVFDAAYELYLNSAANGYIVFIDANSTKYLVTFDASGNFVKAYTVR